MQGLQHTLSERLFLNSVPLSLGAAHWRISACERHTLWMRGYLIRTSRSVHQLLSQSSRPAGRFFMSPSQSMQATASTDEEPIRYPVPPFTEETARQKVKAAQDGWNTRNPEKVSLAYTPDSDWHNREHFFKGRDAIVSFLTKKWEMELDYKLVKELWTYNGNRIAVRFEYEFHDEAGKWFRAHGNENWEFDERGYMRKRDACINNVPIEDSVRRLEGWEIHDKA